MSDENALAAAQLRRKRKQEEQEEELIKSGGDESVAVCVRVRPFNRRELEIQKTSGQEFVRSVVEMPEGIGGKIVCMEKLEGSNDYNVVEEFKFTKSFWSIPEEQQPSAFSPIDQIDVFENVGIPVLKYAFVGFHNCVFAYGQTGSGKTYTMMGDFETKDGEWAGNPGIIPRLCRELFSKIEEKKALIEDGIVKTFDVKLSAIEIYNEAVRDLFWRNAPGRQKTTVLKVRKHPVEGAFVDQLTILNPKTWVECIHLIAAGISERTVAATLMNDESSRSHSVFQITLTQTESVHIRSDDPNDRYSKPVTHTKVSKINLVDLAGSERLKKSGAQGQHLKEAAGINQSLSTLKKVIDALVHNGKEPNQKKHVVIPFRESTLTLLLSHSLGGNSKTTMIACVSPHYDNQEETLLTMRYANRTSGIVNHATVNEDNAAKAALALKHQILALQRRLADGEDEEAEELKDQLELGKQSLKDLEAQNARLEEQAKDMRQKTKEEEGARYAAAFYNSLKMVMLQNEKEELDKDVGETSARLAEEKRRHAALQTELNQADEKQQEQERRIETLHKDENERLVIEMQQDQYSKQLMRDSHQVQKKLEQEVEFRYAQKLVNASKLKRVRDGNEKEIHRVEELNDQQLEAIIQQAAEQYERQVRQFADADVAKKHRIAAAEKRIPEMINEREDVERQSAELQREISRKDKEHAQRMEGIEERWKTKYADMKTEYEKTIARTEEENYNDRRDWDEIIDDENVEATHEQLAQIAALESQIRTKETLWSGKVASSCSREAEKMDQDAKTETGKQVQAVAAVRHKYQKKIAELIAHLQAIEASIVEHGMVYKHLEEQISPLMGVHDDLKASSTPTSTCSPELRNLLGILKEYRGEYSSMYPNTSPLGKKHHDPNNDDPTSPDGRSSTGSQQQQQQVFLSPGGRLKVNVPPVEFYPLAKPQAAPEQQRAPSRSLPSPAPSMMFSPNRSQSTRKQPSVASTSTPTRRR